MKTILRCACCALLLIACGPAVRASLLLPMSPEEQTRRAAAVFRGSLVSVACYEDAADGFIYTRAVVRVEEVFKGKLPALLRLVYRGGEVGTRGEMNDLAPQLRAGEERLFFVGRRADGTACIPRGEAGAPRLSEPVVSGISSAADSSAVEGVLQSLRTQTRAGVLAGQEFTGQAATSQESQALARPSGPVPATTPVSTATNLTVGGDGIPARFLQPDRGEGIPYFIDADYLPSGVTQAQAVSAVQAALAAWTNVTSLRYVYGGLQSFGMAASDVPKQNGRLLIQLHDHYNAIAGTGGDALGVGGHGWTISTTPSGWTTGGTVIGNDFHKVTGGSVVIQHTNSFMQNLSNLAEVLCHEIGHTIGLGHSSLNPSEPNPLLAQAIMYYSAHGSGRGATPNAWDVNVVRQVHPPTNTPPWCYDRMIDAVTSPGSIATPGVNQVRVLGYDLQTTNLTLATADPTALSGSFSVVNSNITYLPGGWYGDSPRADPAGGGYYELIYARFSDGVNFSPYAKIRVVSLWSDSYSEGIPDTWRLIYFGSANPSAGSLHHVLNDSDGDGFNNLVEWQLGSNPTNRNSNLRIMSFSPTNIQWQAKGYEVYEVYGSTNLSQWTRVLNPIVPTNFVPGTDLFNLTNSIGVATGFTNGGPRQFFRIQKLP